MDLDIKTVSVTKEYPNGDIYEGILIKDLKEVKGITRNKKSSFFRELKSAQEKLKIVFYYADKEFEKKKFPDEKLNGRDLFFYEGDKYVGEFNKDQIHGKGIMTWKNGNK